MKTIKTLENGSKKSEILLSLDNTYFVQSTRNGNATHRFPFKYYNTLKGAINYANKFLNA